MNRAFVGENDGWKRCRKKMEDCMMSDENGNCILDHCRLYPDGDPRPNALPKEKEPKEKAKKDEKKQGE